MNNKKDLSLMSIEEPSQAGTRVHLFYAPSCLLYDFNLQYQLMNNRTM